MRMESPLPCLPAGRPSLSRDEERGRVGE